MKAWLAAHKRRERMFAVDLVAFFIAQKQFALDRFHELQPFMGGDTGPSLLRPEDVIKLLPPGETDRALAELGDQHVYRAALRGVQLSAVRIDRHLKARATNPLGG